MLREVRVKPEGSPGGQRDRSDCGTWTRCSNPPAQQKRLRAAAHLAGHTRGVDAIEEVADHPLLTLLRSVNPVHNAFDLWELTQLSLETVGAAYWLLDLDGPFGTPAAIWPLPAHKVRPHRERNSADLLDWYEYRDGSAYQRYEPGRVSLREAARLGVSRVAFAPLIRDQGNTKLDTRDVETAVVRGMLLAYDTEKRLQNEGLSKDFTLDQWNVEAGPKYFDDTVTGVQKAIEEAAKAIKDRSTNPLLKGK